jgi:hypothetical protein
MAPKAFLSCNFMGIFLLANKSRIRVGCSPTCGSGW